MLAFALGRCPRMVMRAQQTDNRREYSYYLPDNNLTFS